MVLGLSTLGIGCGKIHIKYSSFINVCQKFSFQLCISIKALSMNHKVQPGTFVRLSFPTSLSPLISNHLSLSTVEASNKGIKLGPNYYYGNYLFEYSNWKQIEKRKPEM